jgi:hypothetical protein
LDGTVEATCVIAWSWLRNDVDACDDTAGFALEVAGFALEVVGLDEHAAAARPSEASRTVARCQDFTKPPSVKCGPCTVRCSCYFPVHEKADGVVHPREKKFDARAG